METLDEEVDVGLEQGFLLTQGFVGESVGEEAAVAGVVGVVGGDDGVDAVDLAAHPDGVFGEVLNARGVAVDVLEGGSVNEGEFVGADADYVSVLVVDFFDAVDEIAALQSSYIGNAGDGPQFWS